MEAQAQQQQQEPDASHKKILSSSCSNAAETSSQQPEEKGAQKEGEGEEEIIDEDPELTARFSSVSQIEAQPTIDPNTGEAIYPCPFCDKSYGGKHARSIWRRHLSNKHGIPLNLQPRRTRWDNGELFRPSLFFTCSITCFSFA